MSQNIDIEKAFDLATKMLEKQAQQDFARWKQDNPIVEKVIIECSIREPHLSKVLKTIWEKGFLAGYLRAVEAAGLIENADKNG